MTVAELKKALAEFPDDWEVIVSRDAEGNEFKPLSEVGAEEYVAEWEEISDGEPNAVVLWPV